MKFRRRLTIFMVFLMVLGECLPVAPVTLPPVLRWHGEAVAAPNPARLPVPGEETVAKTWGISISEAGFTPSALTMTVGEQVEWHNTTGQTQILRSGIPSTTLEHAVYLPVVARSTGTFANARVTMEAAPIVAEDLFEVTLPPDGRFTHAFTGVGEQPYYLANNPAHTGKVIVQTPDSPPVPPNTGAVPVSLFDSSKFLYTGEHPRQIGVAPGVIDPQRVVVLRGTASNRAGESLAGVKVKILDHPEFGWTFTQDDGSFDMVVNGGGPTTVVFEKSGFLSIQRTATLPWQDYAIFDAIVLIALDAQVTTIDLGDPADFQSARGTVQTDNDGTRQATLLIGNGTQASMTLPDGKIKTLSTLKIRATEYTVGNPGMAAMPGTLPPSSGYTYAVEFTVDEALAAGATNVEFSKPLINYTENFIDAPVGSPVPTGYYDREQGQWVPSKNGIVIKLVAESQGKAELDVTGDGAADSGDTLTAIGITDAELIQLADLYNAG